MNNRMKNVITEMKLRAKFARVFKISPAAQEKAKQVFLNTLTETVGIKNIKPIISPYRTWARYAIAVIIGVVILNSGAVIYANTANVAPDHPLYSYKRIAEEIELTVTPFEKKAEVEIKLAERRKAELELVVKNKKAQKEKQEDTSNNVVITATSSVNVTSSSTAVSSTATSTVSTSSNVKKNALKKVDRIQKKLEEDLKENVKHIKESVERLPEHKREEKRAVVCPGLIGISKNIVTLTDIEQDIKEFCTQNSGNVDKPEKKATPAINRETKTKAEVKAQASESIKSDTTQETKKPEQKTKTEGKVNTEQIINTVKTNIGL